jgi:hypothetical protein
MRRKNIEAISNLGFSVEISRRRSAGQECEAENQPTPSKRDLRHAYSNMSRAIYEGTTPVSDEKTFLRWLLVSDKYMQLVADKDESYSNQDHPGSDVDIFQNF